MKIENSDITSLPITMREKALRGPLSRFRYPRTIASNQETP